MTIPGSWNVILDPVQVAEKRTELNLNKGPIRVDQKGIDWGDAAITAYTADQTWGTSPVDFRVPNRQVQIPLFLGADESDQEEEVRAQLQTKVALLQREGGWLKRQRYGPGSPPMYADVVNATLGLPDVYGETGGVEPNVVLTLECLPDFYGDEIVLDMQSAAGILTANLVGSGAQAVIAGDHPGRVRINVTDTSGNDQKGLLWAFRSRYAQGDPNNPDINKLFYEAESMTPLDAAGLYTNSSASGGATNNTVRHPSLQLNWTNILSTTLTNGNPPTMQKTLGHIGSYRVWARVTSINATPQFRLIWGLADMAHYIANDPVKLPSAGVWHLLDLGVVHLQESPIGAQSWTGIIQGLAGVQNDPASIDCIYLQPLDEGAGQLVSVTQSPLVVWDNHWSPASVQNNSSAGSLDWSIPANVFSGGGGTVSVQPTGAGNTYDSAILLVLPRGTGGAAVIETAANRADTSTPWPFQNQKIAHGGSSDLWGQSLSYTDVNSPNFGVAIAANVDGNVTHYAVVTNFGFNLPTTANIRGIQVFIQKQSYTQFVWSTTLNAWQITTWAGFNFVDIAVFYTQGGNPITAQDAVLYANKRVECRTDGVFRNVSGSSQAPDTYAPVGEVIGDLPRIPPSGMEGRPVQIFVKPTRSNFPGTVDSTEGNKSDDGLDGFQVQVIYRPTYLHRK